jgi:hypothetical protein
MPLLFYANGWFQHDGAPPQVREILDQQYPHRWIGRGGLRHWPPRFPDLNPLDFFLKNVYINVYFEEKKSYLK